jgi:hypothetical protein
MEYFPTKLGDFVRVNAGKYTSTMVRIWAFSLRYLLRTTHHYRGSPRRFLPKTHSSLHHVAEEDDPPRIFGAFFGTPVMETEKPPTAGATWGCMNGYEYLW